MSLTEGGTRRHPQGISHRLRPAFVAEFLEPLSPACLGILYLRTSVGLRYGKKVLLNEIFLESRTICVALALRRRLPITSYVKRNNGFASYHYFEA